MIAAWDFRNGTLTRRWTFDSNASGNGTYAGQGNHQLSIADVDGDGRDEIVYGAMAIDDNGAGAVEHRQRPRRRPARRRPRSRAGPAWRYFKVDEDTSKPAAWMADARTGQILW